MLDESELLNVLRPSQQGNIDEGDEIGEPYEVVDEVVGGNKKGHPFF